MLLEGTINPQILETIPLSQIAEAQDTVENRDFSSFLLCDPWVQTKREFTQEVSHAPIVFKKSASSSFLSKQMKPERYQPKVERSSTGFSKEQLLEL